MSYYRDLMWCETITVYHKWEIEDEYGKVKTEYSRAVYNNCFYNRATSASVSGQNLILSERFVVRIPAEENACVGVEDVVVRGEVTAEVDGSFPISKVKNRYAGRCFTVSSVKEDTKLTETAHLKVEGS
jgi:hypothetical protein